MLPQRPRVHANNNYIGACACEVLLCSEEGVHRAGCHMGWHVALHALCSNQSLSCVRMKRGKLAGLSPKEIRAGWAYP